jgi:hypothetical protein
MLYVLPTVSDQSFNPPPKNKKTPDFVRAIILFLLSCGRSSSFGVIGMMLLNLSHWQFPYSAVYPDGSIVFPQIFAFILFEFYTKLGVQSVIVLENILILTMFIISTSWALSQLK